MVTSRGTHPRLVPAKWKAAASLVLTILAVFTIVFAAAFLPYSDFWFSLPVYVVVEIGCVLLLLRVNRPSWKAPGRP